MEPSHLPGGDPLNPDPIVAGAFSADEAQETAAWWNSLDAD
jgi:hypothetical protein